MEFQLWGCCHCWGAIAQLMHLTLPFSLCRGNSWTGLPSSKPASSNPHMRAAAASVPLSFSAAFKSLYQKPPAHQPYPQLPYSSEEWENGSKSSPQMMTFQLLLSDSCMRLAETALRSMQRAISDQLSTLLKIRKTTNSSSRCSSELWFDFCISYRQLIKLKTKYGVGLLAV